MIVNEIHGRGSLETSLDRSLVVGNVISDCFLINFNNEHATKKKNPDFSIGKFVDDLVCKFCVLCLG